MADDALPEAAMQALHAAGEPFDAFKSAMWRFRSGLNTKLLLSSGAAEAEEGDTPLRRAWAALAPLVEAHAARIIRRGFA